MNEAELTQFLASTPPFDGLAPKVVQALGLAARVATYAAGELVLDAFSSPSSEVFVVLSGKVDLRNDADRGSREPHETLGPGDIFGFSAMLTERSVGPLAIAAQESVIACLPAEAVAPVFATRAGSRFLAHKVYTGRQVRRPVVSYNGVEDLLSGPALIVGAETAASDVARSMTASGTGYAVVDLGQGSYGLVTDSSLREHVVSGAMAGSAPAATVMVKTTAVASMGDSAAEALMGMLEIDADHVVVLDAERQVRGVVSMRDFTLSPTTADMSLNERMRRSATVTDLASEARRIPTLLDDLLSRGLGSGKVISIYSTMIDAVIRRAIELVFAQHDEVSPQAFTWLSLGSNGRREAVLSSDVDSAVSFTRRHSETSINAYLTCFAEVHDVLVHAGMVSDTHGATAQRRLFARTNTDWRAAAEQWLAHPEQNQGAIMTSLMVDGRPIIGSSGTPAVTRVFTDLRNHPGTMRLLLQESLSQRAKRRTNRDLLARRPAQFDIKQHALLPIVNVGRWAALSVGSAALPTVDRLGAASGSAMLPTEQASILIEIFEVLQRLRLRYQLLQIQDDDHPSDRLAFDRMSPLDRSVIAQAVHEIAAVQRRMATVSNYLSTDEWTEPAPS